MLKRGFLLSSTFRCAEEKTTTTTAAAADDAEECDRISALPDEVLHHILSFMHTDTAVRTSILSNRWRHLYKFNPVIDFAPLSFDPRRPVDYNYITQTLNLHRTLKIRKFCVVVRLGWTSLPDIKIWVDFAVARAVRCLRIGLVPFTGSYLELPDSLYTCNTQYIEYMFFSCVDFSPPMSGFMGFASLRTLSLFYSKLTDEVVMEIVSKCLLLEDLTIDKCVGLSTVKIVAPELRLRRFVFRWSFLGEDRIELDVDAPSLVSLKYYGSLSKIRLRKGPCLVEARIFDRGVDETNIGNARALMREISHVKLLGVNSWFPQFVAKQYYANGRRCTTFQNLNKFRWFGPLESERDLVTLFAFLGDCPSLERMEVDFRDRFWNGFGDFICMNVDEPSFVDLESGGEELHVGCLYRLKAVDMFNISGYKCERELLKWLLQKAVVLETLYLEFERVGDESRKKLLLEYVFLLPKASSCIQVLYS